MWGWILRRKFCSHVFRHQSGCTLSPFWSRSKNLVGIEQIHMLAILFWHYFDKQLVDMDWPSALFIVTSLVLFLWLLSCETLPKGLVKLGILELSSWFKQIISTDTSNSTSKQIISTADLNRSSQQWVSTGDFNSQQLSPLPAILLITHRVVLSA